MDRFYVSSQLIPYIRRADIYPESPSDHLPIFLHLLPLPSHSFAATNRRVRCEFLADPSLKEDFEGWVEAKALFASGLDDQSLLHWWPSFKVALRDKALALGAAAARSSPSPSSSPSSSDLREELAAAVASAESRRPSGPALRRIIDARRAFVAATVSSAIQAETRRHRHWLAAGERPSPLLSKLARCPRLAKCILALRDANGLPVSDGPALASMVAKYWASISSSSSPPSSSTSSPSAQDQVLASVAKHAARLDSGVADLAGSPTVELGSVLAACRSTKPGKSPGPDGIPAELWRRCLPLLGRVLAQLFSAIGKEGVTPKGFLDGDIRTIYKQGGDPLLCASYRPITLLNTDYRLCAKIIANRLGPALATVIGPEQTAFLPGRLMGDNISFLQLLPQALRCNAAHPSQGLATSAVIAFLDFRKAYDTVVRRFLFRVMEVVGAGSRDEAGRALGILRWAELFLPPTTSASATVNGHTSAQETFRDGVRQGCPASPLLYLFITWALSCWLRDCPVVGVKVTTVGDVVRGDQYADDSHPVLRSLLPEDIRIFLDFMNVFGEATNQWLNLDKVRLLLVGVPPSSPPPPSVHGLPIVSSVTSLGIPFSNDPAGQAPDWEEALDGVEQCYTRLASFGLSVFGRARAAASYGMGTIYHLLEFCGPPPAPQATLLSQWANFLIDRGLPPTALSSSRRRHASYGRRPLSPPPPLGLPGLHSDHLHGRPEEGGFGGIPWEQHLSARVFMWARRYLEWILGDPSSSPLLPLVPTRLGQ